MVGVRLSCVQAKEKDKPSYAIDKKGMTGLGALVIFMIVLA